MADYLWPVLDWTVGEKKLSWLLERTKQLAVLARAFEVALEEASAAGEAPLSKAAVPLGDWEHAAANVWMYAGLEDAKKIPPDDVQFHAEELAKIYATLQEKRAEILTAIGADASAKVQDRERAAKVDDASIQQRVGELPSFQETSALGAMTSMQFTEPPEAPITPDELKSRDSAERKTLPDDANFQTLLNLLPPPWVNAVFETHGLLLELSEDDEEAEEVELTANSRSTMQKKMLSEKIGSLLREAVFALEEEDRKLIEELISAGGALKYSDARTKYGKDDADGFHWGDRPPSGTIARLRRVGIAFVGMRGGKQVLALPTDLIPSLTAVLATR